MNWVHRTICALALASLLAGCAAPPPAQPSVTSEITTTSALTPLPQQTEEVDGAAPVTLTIWLPPEFDPASGTPAGDLLAARLAGFSAGHPGVRVVARIKALSGPAGLFASLASASSAAPLALPDLIALPRADLQSAAGNNLLHPLDNLLSNPQDEDWYPYARQLAVVADETYGVPFAGDALALVYRPAAVPAAPSTWEDALALSAPLVFPAADPQARFTLLQYAALGGTFTDDEGKFVLNADALEQVLAFYAFGQPLGITPFWLTQYDSEAQTWQAFVDGDAEVALAWASAYLQARPEDSAAGLLPTREGNDLTYASGWAWALTNPDPRQYAVTVALAEFLTEPEFLAAWTQAAGYLPPRPSSLASWMTGPKRDLAEQLCQYAILLPDVATLQALGNPVSAAVIAVLKDEAEPTEAAQNAAAAVDGE